MKKLSILFSLLVLGALVLTACGPNTNNNSNDNNGVENGTPAALETPAGGVVLDTTPTVGADDGALATETLAVPAATETVAAPADATATVGTDATATTPQADVPVTGTGQCSYNRVDNLLDYEVMDSAGAKAGDVEGVLVQRDVAFVVDEDTLEDNADTTATNTTPTAPAGSAVGAAGAAPRLQYVIVDLENNDTDVLVPYSAFDTTQTDSASLDDCGLTLVTDAAILNNAPAYGPDNIDFNLPDWDKEFNAYWTGQSLNVPASGDFTGTPVVIDDEKSDVPVRNFQGDDLGEAEDFFFDPATGNFTYALLATGGFLGLGEKYVPVPVNHFQWAYEDAKDTQEMDELGYLLINLNEDAWKTVPTFDGLDKLDTTVEGWDKDIVTFWNSIK